jgi:hypothetical protein
MSSRNRSSKRKRKAAKTETLRSTAGVSNAFGLLKHKGKRRLSVREIGKITAEGWAGKR